MVKIGLDIGSTTIKYVVMNEKNEIVEKDYARHMSLITNKAIEILTFLQQKYPICKLSISGSAGMGLAKYCNVHFVQEVYSEKIAADQLLDHPDVIIELGGEDAKIIFLSSGLEVRMNGSCAGGTGAFIDQMALLLHIDGSEVNEYAKKYEKMYTIASRCGVFAKSDIQPLINQGAKKEDLAKSIFYAVANQTIGGLSQGREIKGKVIYLGGPLTFNSELRKCFDETLSIQGMCPENSLYYVAIGAALLDPRETELEDVIHLLKQYQKTSTYQCIDGLFSNVEEYEVFKKRHEQHVVLSRPIETYEGNAYLGIDAGSTTLKIVLIDEENRLLYTDYQPNNGQAISFVTTFLKHLYKDYPNIHIVSSAVTGYGEELLKAALNIDWGVVETIAHYTSASYFIKDVDFIIDIGGQDIKCFKIKNGYIDHIFLNEACSSGCGSFLQTFANALGYEMAEFAKLGLYADKPVDLGSRCTVFMNSLVKQAQKDGASIENISAGLSISVVKNALYKVIRTTPDQLGKNIVVQGGTFYNDAVLRAFEKELGLDVIRPNIAGLMGAYGAALYAKRHPVQESTLLNLKQIEQMKMDIIDTQCQGCTNHCSLTIHRFENGRKYIQGNRCDKPVTNKSSQDEYNIFQYKRKLLSQYQSKEDTNTKRGVIGIPLVLNMYDLLPFWYTLFTHLGFKVVTTGFSTQALYIKGQKTIPSDTVCYPAKLVHGHIESLLEQPIDALFYPSMTYNLDEHLGDNHYNCPVVAYYPEVIQVNVKRLRDKKFIHDYIGISNKQFPKKFLQVLNQYFKDITLKELKKAIAAGKEAYQNYHYLVDQEVDKIIERSRQENRQIIVLAGRPYHLDPKVDHEIDKLIVNLGASVVCEDSIARRSQKHPTTVINQWTYHARLYAAAYYCLDYDDMNLIQLVSFGCGLDAVTTDEVKSILEKKDKIYTQIKIDEITNLGAAKIRLRSLLSAIGERNGKR